MFKTTRTSQVDKWIRRQGNKNRWQCNAIYQIHHLVVMAPIIAMLMIFLWCIVERNPYWH
ncbi:hypothetical protein ACE8FZ_18440 [Peribacillus frigoritolerans]|uniref:hypothetical protein n=1 Tax=Peribacillus frigoritolerans TaxID=450367 RepID=UPI0035CF5465